MIQPADDFLDSLTEKLQILLPHSFIAKEQNAFLTYTKTELEENEYVVVCDFSENVSPFVYKIQSKDFIGTTHKRHCIQL